MDKANKDRIAMQENSLKADWQLGGSFGRPIERNLLDRMFGRLEEEYGKTEEMAGCAERGGEEI